jgi:hypothetical protein
LALCLCEKDIAHAHADEFIASAVIAGAGFEVPLSLRQLSR